MPKIDVINIKGEKIEELTLSDAIFGIEPNEAAVHQVVVAQLANKRQGTQSAKTRSEVRGGGRKPWRQKGTGRARAGTIRSPLWKGGGVIFAPKPRDYTKKVNKKMNRLAMKSVLSAKVAENELLVLDSIVMDAPKTKEMTAILSAIKAGKKTIIVLDSVNENIYKSARNIEGVITATVDTLNVYDLLNYDCLVATKGSVEKIEEVYA
ncbi:50S ribosomal protein L4 [Alkalibacter rhizosphaerae]|uniref:Large ribosomal subunit protein uL4 n=1 Tax=Alkalibacter rhizosphaerae TaxID=2815577 RepID=A0A975AGF6_9FIRM|nr:50S ribosomal protein L4 [Alkalibacter rhizosphaerae]QSX07489.1 50S ribosomal protein L4 [Alkalibacter rhizosphaerae]